MQARGVRFIAHYIDDFITVGAPQSQECQNNVEIMDETFAESGLPVELEKNEGPASTLGVLGLELDTVAMEVRLPREKLENIKAVLRTWRGRKEARKRELLSLIGVLFHACKAVRAGRSFSRRLIDLSTVAKHPDHFIRLGKEARADVEWWVRHCELWNGVSMMSAVKKDHPDLTHTSDASGNWGCGAYCGPRWFMVKCVEPIASLHITVKELAPIVVAAAVWGDSWRGKTVRVYCDNSAVVSIVNRGTTKNQEAMHLIRCLAFIRARFEFHIHALHIKGGENTLADALSRNNLKLFHSLYPQAYSSPATIPEALLDVLMLKKPNWNSRNWTGLWSDIFKTA